MKKLILLIFVVAASLNAQAVQGQIGQVPVVAAADNSPVGGAGNLTTVGSVPYVSASGILNQDAGQLHWDATNNRLGIGSNAPITLLHAQGPAFTTFTNNPATLFMSSTDAYAANMGSGILFAGKLDSGNTTLNTYAYIGGLKENATDGNSAGKLVFGTRQAGTGASDMTRMTILSSGNVGIGTTAPGLALDVLGSARVYSSTADAAILFGSDQVDANSGKISYNRGTANLDITPRSTYATNLIGKLKFSITNSTGAGSALLGANSPAITLTAPYTWITVITSDGYTGYMPIWR